VFGCCAFLPLSLLMLIAPMLSAGRGWRALVVTLFIEVCVVIVVLLTSFSAIVDAIEHRDGLFLVPFFVLLVFPVALSGIILHVKQKESEESTPKVCRVCGYDLRATPERCPECGTMVRHDPERF
jgi:hypothetical protein